MKKASAAKWLIALLLSAILLVNYAAAFSASKGLDFYAFYAAAQMVRSGQGADLYDLRKQEEFQLRTTGESGVTFNYPPVAVLPYLPIASLSLPSAHTAWIACSMLMLAICALSLHQLIGAFPDQQWTYLAMYLFVPVHVLLLQGQISAVILVSYVFSLWAWKENKPFISGLILSAGLIKFHLVLPVAGLFLLRQKWRWSAGFVCGSSLFVSICVLISGWHFLGAYREALEFHLRSASAAGYNPGIMANLHGLLFLLLRSEPPFFVEAALCAVVFFVTLALLRDSENEFGAALLMTVLVSRHLNPHDLVLLIIPLMLLSKGTSWRSLKGATLLVVGLPVVPAILLTMHLLPLITIFLLVLWWYSFPRGRDPKINLDDQAGSFSRVPTEIRPVSSSEAAT